MIAKQSSVKGEPHIASIGNANAHLSKSNQLLVSVTLIASTNVVLNPVSIDVLMVAASAKINQKK
ncbi:hypothetical protein J1N35_043788, partial [Gossypium stocksii]